MRHHRPKCAHCRNTDTDACRSCKLEPDETGDQIPCAPPPWGTAVRKPGGAVASWSALQTGRLRQRAAHRLSTGTLQVL